jgi:hypothetical protein
MRAVNGNRARHLWGRLDTLTDSKHIEVPGMANRVPPIQGTNVQDIPLVLRLHMSTVGRPTSTSLSKGRRTGAIYQGCASSRGLLLFSLPILLHLIDRLT